MASEASPRDPAEVPGLSPLPAVHMERLSSWHSLPDDDTAEESSNKNMNAAVSAATDDAEAGNSKLGTSVSGESSIRRVFSNGNPNYHNVSDCLSVHQRLLTFHDRLAQAAHFSPW